GASTDMPINLWQPGESGNPAGRTRGSRNKLSEEVICALLPEGAHSAHDASTSGRLISRTWRVVFFEREDLPCLSMDHAPSSSVPPKMFEPVGRHFGVPDRVLNVLVPEVVLKGARVVAIIGELEPASVAKHVRVDREWHVSGFPESLDEAMESDGADRPTALG